MTEDFYSWFAKRSWERQWKQEDARKEFEARQTDPEYQRRVQAGMEILNYCESGLEAPIVLPPTTPAVKLAEPKPDPKPVRSVLSENLDKYRIDARMTKEQLAAQVVRGDTKALREHISGKRKMRLRQIQDYETYFSKRFGRKVSLDNYTPPS
jgi:hypothetical protein